MRGARGEQGPCPVLFLLSAGERGRGSGLARADHIRNWSRGTLKRRQVALLAELGRRLPLGACGAGPPSAARPDGAEVPLRAPALSPAGVVAALPAATMCTECGALALGARSLPQAVLRGGGWCRQPGTPRDVRLCPYELSGALRLPKG